MTHEQFKTQIDRMVSVYGARHYPEERIKIYWDMVHEGDVHMFSKAVRGWIRDNTQPALGKFFEDFQVSILKNSHAVLGHQQSSCNYCLDSGMVIATEKVSKDETVFLCSYCSTAVAKNITGETPGDRRRIAVWRPDSHWKLFDLKITNQEVELSEAGQRFLANHGFYSIKKRLTDILLETMPSSGSGHTV